MEFFLENFLEYASIFDIHFFLFDFFSAFQRRSRYRSDSRRFVQWLYLHQPPLLVSRRLRNSPPWKAGTGNNNNNVNNRAGSSIRTNLFVSGMDAGQVGRPDHQRRRGDVSRRKQFCDLSRKVSRIDWRSGRDRVNRIQIFAPPSDRLWIALLQLRSLPQKRLECHGIPIRYGSYIFICHFESSHSFAFIFCSNGFSWKKQQYFCVKQFRIVHFKNILT